ncbi:nicotinate-nucleotide adenylyltransferase [Elongatibacter sediminis]|uniref:Probable nicotinate-nucleotide adenylyltransferase n=1 Tax=Elongatibacter sediminis TaxID=3119006 RepID=A0AAW9RHW5_9GAMM
MIGIFGGTFDPVHYGHLRAAVEARERLGLNHVRLLPAGEPPHRSGTFASAGHRLEMLRAAVEGRTDLKVDDREVRRAGRSYMSDTLTELRAEAGDTALLLMIGQDAANALDSWHDWRRLFELAHIVIMRRPDAVHACSERLAAEIGPRRVQGPEDLRQRPAGYVLPLEVTQLAISSTGIREMIAAGRSPAFLLPDAVIDHIDRSGNYREGVARS